VSSGKAEQTGFIGTWLLKIYPVKAASKRLFLALWPGECEQERFYTQARQHRPTAECRLVAAHRLHLTLCFLGSVDNTASEHCVCTVASTIAWRPFAIEFDRLGWFAQPRVMWIGCSDIPAQLPTLVTGLQSGFAQCGFEPERRHYRPHITVARKVMQSPEAKEVESTSCYFDSLALVESRMGRRGVEYITLASWPAQMG